MEATSTFGRPSPAFATFNRRDLLKTGALLLSATLIPDAVAHAATSAPVPLTAWVRIASDNSITVIASQSEMGQGTTTTLAAALADELYVPLDRVKIAFALFDPAYRDPVY